MQVFISYSRKDERWLKMLQTHFTPLERDYGIDIWDDTKIGGGDDWREEIRRALDSAKVAILLVSANFMASRFINDEEIPPLLEAAKSRGTIILPVVLNASLFFKRPELAKYNALPRGGKPLGKMSAARREEELASLAAYVLKLMTETRESGGPAAPTSAPASPSASEPAPDAAPLPAPAPAAASLPAAAPAPDKSSRRRAASRPASAGSAAPDPSAAASTKGGRSSRSAITPENVKQLKAVRDLRGLTGAPGGVAFSPDGSLVAAACWDKTVRLWRTSSGETHNVLAGPSEIACISFSSDGKFVAAGLVSAEVCVWEVATGAFRRKVSFTGFFDYFNETGANIYDLAFRPDSYEVVAATHKGVQIFDALGGGKPRTLLAQETICLAFSRDGRFLAFDHGANDGLLIYKMDDGSTRALSAPKRTGFLSSLTAPVADMVADVSFSPKGQHLAAISHDGTLHLWRLRDETFLPLAVNSDKGLAVAFNPKGDVLASSDGPVRLWRAPDGKHLRTLDTGSVDAQCLAFSPDGEFLALGLADASVQLWGVR